MEAKVARQESIERRLLAGLSPSHLDVENESRMHNVPPGSETHFRVVVVSAAFEGLNRLDRHRMVNGLLREEFQSGLHALTLRTMTPGEWSEQGADEFKSPKCLGGSKAN